MVTTKETGGFFSDILFMMFIAVITPIMLVLGIVSAISGHNLMPEL